MRLAAVILCAFAAVIAPARAAEVIDVAPVWAGHPTGFELLTDPPNQYVAYYDADRNMTVASRKLGEKEWQYQILPEKIGWDSHNYVTMTLDSNGDLHVSGNMHVHPLVYFRTEKPGDISTFKRHEQMVGREEQRVTYPRFFEGPGGKLLFTYRDGSSGSGNQIYNVYDAEKEEWRRLLDTPLVDGQGEMNAYLIGPKLGPDGYYHLVWVWRDTPDAATNHDLSYARSKDLKNWETSSGEKLELPITIDTVEVVDPVSAGGGIINGNTKFGFDSEGRIIISYHKYDEEGNLQLYVARREAGGWNIVQVSDWDYRWDFGGGGSIGFEVRVPPVYVQDGKLVQPYSHEKLGSGRWELDPETLKPVGEGPKPKRHFDLPLAMYKPQSEFPGISVRTSADSGNAPEGASYYLRWETLGANRDRPRPEPWPEPTMLQVIKVQD